MMTIGKPLPSLLPPPPVPEPTVVALNVFDAEDVSGRFHFNSPFLLESALVCVTLPGRRMVSVNDASLRIMPSIAWLMASSPALVELIGLATASNFQPSDVFVTA